MFRLMRRRIADRLWNEERNKKYQIQPSCSLASFLLFFLTTFMNRGFVQKIAIAAVVTIIVIGLLSFIFLTFQAYFSGPNISITRPADYAAFSVSTTTISGIAKRIQDITLDGRSITIDDKGNFSETILLMPGYNIEIIAAHDQFGHTTQKKLELVYNAPITAVPTASTSTATSS